MVEVVHAVFNSLSLIYFFLASWPPRYHDQMFDTVHTLGLGGRLKAKVTRVRKEIERETGRERPNGSNANGRLSLDPYLVHWSDIRFLFVQTGENKMTFS